MKFHTKPWKHQIQALKYLMARNAGALYTKPGSGKTKVMVDLVVNKGFKYVLVVAPKKACKVWATEFYKHAPNENYTVINLSEVPGNRKAELIREVMKLDGKNGFTVVINYDSIWRKPFKDFLLKKPPEAVICDESHRIKGAGSKVSKYLAALGKRVNNRYLITGTPIHESPLDAYGQYRFLDPTIFGTNYDRFKHQYANFVPGLEFDMLDKNNPYKNMDEFEEKFFSCAFVSTVQLDLPPTLDIEVEFDLSSKASTLYKKLLKEKALELSQDKYLLPKNILSVLSHLQQLSSGYLKLDGGDIEEVDTSRQSAFRELIEDLPLDESVVVFCKYKKDLKNTRKVLSELGREVYEISGRADEYKEFKASKPGSAVVVQISAGAEGIDLTEARYCVYYSLTHSNLSYDQSRFRVHRPGQTRPVTYYTLIAKVKGVTTVDEQILNALRNKTKLVDEIMKNGGL